MEFFNLRKRVSFNNMARIILIPSRQEYHTFKETLWYDEIEFAKFMREEMERRRNQYMQPTTS
jgi:hypothetical protein|tara:strand:+ start:193 stop:381 length:189 start_codon:yes stop_codon:yes gene_type:complete